MSCTLARVGLPGGLAVVLSWVIAGAQDRAGGEPAGQDALEVFNSLEGRTTVVKSMPDGTRVDRGETICELDSSILQDRLAVNRLTEQIRRCKVTAPGKGLIKYATPIGPGAVVHDGQLICRVIADGRASTLKAK